MSSIRTDVNVDLRLPTRTPGRSRAENVKAGCFSTNIRKGKNELLTKSPLHPAAAQLKHLFRDSKPTLGTATQPLGDKTPLPNRLARVAFQTPFDKAKIVKPFNTNVTSSRRHSRLPRNSYAKDFETPVNNVRQWELSDGDISVLDVPSVSEEKTTEDERDLDEIEYCPPNTLDLPYQPPFDFDLPNYKEVGKALRELAFSVPVGDSQSPPVHDIPASELEQVAYNLPPLPPLESDDPFELARLQANNSEKPNIFHKANGISHRRALSSQPSLRISSRNSAQVPRDTLPKTAIFAPSRVQPLNFSSTIEKGKVAKHTKIIEANQPTSQLKTGSRPVVAIPARSRPQTSFSLAPRREPLLRPKSTAPTKDAHNGISREPLTLDLKTFGYEDFMFDV